MVAASVAGNYSRVMSRVAAITVTHDSAHAIDAWLDAIGSLPVAAIVVDNASSDDTRARVASRPNVTLVALPDNRGFAAANNVGLARARDVAPAADLVLFVNPDVIVNRAALDAMVRALDREPRAAAAVPSLRAPDGRVRAGAEPEPRLSDVLFGVFGVRRRRVADLARRLATPGEHPLADAYCEGGCLLARRAALEAIAGFDERFFLYFEDADLSRRLRARGHVLLHDGSAVVDELGTKGARAPGVACDAGDRAWRRARFLESESRWFEKWAGPGAATVARVARSARAAFRRD